MNKEKVLNIPEHWGECKLGDVGFWGSGGTPLKSRADFYTNGKINWVKTGDLNDGDIFNTSEKITDSGFTSISSKLYLKETIIIAMYGATIGKLGILKIRAAVNQACACCEVHPALFNLYLFYYLKFYKKEFIALGYGGAQPNISRQLIYIQPFPLAPKKEQERIVKKIESCFAKIEATESNLDKIENLLAKYKESILSKAFRGELVPRIEKEGNGWELLEEAIGKKIPKNKRNSELNIPEHWGESQLINIFEMNPRNKLSDKLQVSFVPMSSIDQLKGVITNYEIRNWENIKKGFTHFQENDIIFAKITPCMENKKSAIAKNLKNGFAAGSTEFHVLRSKININLFLYFYFIRSDFFIKEAKKNMRGSAGQKRVPTDWLEKQIIGIPPLKEQERIVQKIEHYFSKIEEIEKQVKQKRILLKKLKESILTKAFSGNFVERIENEGTGHDLLKEILSENKKHEKVKKSIPVKKHPKKIKNENNECRI